MHYNTTNESGETLKDFQKKAQTQEGIIMDFFMSWDELYSSINNKGYGASELGTKAFGDWRKPPITSIRRAVTNLVNDGKLEYTGEKRIGMYGRPEKIFKLKK